MKIWLLNFIVLFVSLGYLFDVRADDAQSMRIVSVNGALTEMIYLLEAESKLVGVDTTSQFPEQAQQLPQVGYQRSLSAEGILSLQPTHLIASADAGPPAVLNQIKSAGVKIIQFDRAYTLESVLDRITNIAQLLEKERLGKNIVEGIRQQHQSLFEGKNQTSRNFNTQEIAQLSQNTTSKFREKTKVLFFLGVGSGSPMVAGSQTAADAMIGFSGGINVFSGIQGYKPVSAEAIINAAPEVILIVSHGGPDRQQVINKVLMTPGVSETPAGKNVRILVMNGLRFLGFGPRTFDAIRELNQSLYPEMAAENSSSSLQRFMAPSF